MRNGHGQRGISGYDVSLETESGTTLDLYLDVKAKDAIKNPSVEVQTDNIFIKYVLQGILEESLQKIIGSLPIDEPYKICSVEMDEGKLQKADWIIPDHASFSGSSVGLKDGGSKDEVAVFLKTLDKDINNLNLNIEQQFADSDADGTLGIAERLILGHILPLILTQVNDGTASAEYDADENCLKIDSVVSISQYGADVKIKDFKVSSRENGFRLAFYLDGNWGAGMVKFHGTGDCDMKLEFVKDAFAKTRWHSKSRDFTTYTYKCYDQTRTGTVSARLKNGLSIEGVCRVPLVQDWKVHTMAQKVLHAVFDDPEGTLRKAAAIFGLGAAGVGQTEVLRDKSIIEEKLKKEQGRYETLLDMRMNNEIPKEVFSRKQQEVEKKIAELEQQMMQYGDVKPATEADVSGKLENLRRLMGQPPVPEDGEFSEEDIDKYVFGVRVYEDRFEWLLNLSPEARGELDDAGSPVYFTKLTVTPDDERAWFKMHPQWSKSNKYAELEAWIYI